MNKQKKLQTPVVGGSSLLVIFAVLCLTVFALLGFSTVRADMRLSDASAEAVTAYYEAELCAETILAELRSGKVPDEVRRDGTIYSYGCKVSDTQELQVEVRIDGAEWEVLRWQVVSTVDWEEENILAVWGSTQGS